MATRLATAADVPVLRDLIARAPRVAVDTEFHAERRYVPRLLLVQVALPGGDTWVIDPLVPGLLSELAEPLRGTDWIVHGGQQDMRLLHAALGGLPSRVLDTQIGAGLLAPDFPAGFATLVTRWLGIVVDKSATLSDWSRRPLTPAQLDYATRDAELLPPLWDRIEGALRAKGRLDACLAACDEARRAELDPPADDALWSAIHGATNLSRADAAVAQELAAWRERIARETDQPARSVLSDGLLLDLARRRPVDAGSMLTNRRFPKAVAKRYGEELAECIRRAASRPEWAWPRFVRGGSTQAAQVRFLGLWAEIHGRDTGLSPQLVLPRERLEAVILGGSPVEGPDLRAILGDWRADLIAAPLARALRGEIALRLARDGVRADAPPDR